MDLKEVDGRVGDSMCVAQAVDKWQVFVIKVTNLRVLQIASNLTSNC